jgi:hypothetical protein
MQLTVEQPQTIVCKAIKEGLVLWRETSGRTWNHGGHFFGLADYPQVFTCGPNGSQFCFHLAMKLMKKFILLYDGTRYRAKVIKAPSVCVRDKS